MSDPAKKAASRAASRKIAVALRGLSYDDAYSLLSGRLHACFDRLPDASVNMLLMFFITHAMEARAARAEGRDANYHTAHQLTRWAEIRRDEAGGTHHGQVDRRHGAPAVECGARGPRARARQFLSASQTVTRLIYGDMDRRGVVDATKANSCWRSTWATISHERAQLADLY